MCWPHEGLAVVANSFRWNSRHVSPPPLFLGSGKVPGILDISFGPTFTTDRSNGYTHALVVDLDDKAALEVVPDCQS